MNPAEIINSVKSCYPELDVDIVFSKGIIAVRDGKILIDMDLVAEIAFTVGVNQQEVLEYIAHHEISHYRNKERGVFKNKIKILPGNERQFRVLFGTFLSNERKVMKNAVQTPISQIMDKNGLDTYKKLRVQGISLLKSGKSFFWTIRE